MVSPWKPSVSPHLPPTTLPTPAKALGSGSRSVTCEGECVCASCVNSLFPGGAHSSPGCLLCGILRCSDHSAPVTGGVEVTPAAMRGGLHGGRADSPAGFGVLGRAVGVGGVVRGEEDFTASFRYTRGRVLWLSRELCATKFTNKYLKIHKKRNEGSLCPTKGTSVERTQVWTEGPEPRVLVLWPVFSKPQLP